MVNSSTVRCGGGGGGGSGGCGAEQYVAAQSSTLRCRAVRCRAEQYVAVPDLVDLSQSCLVKAVIVRFATVPPSNYGEWCTRYIE